MYYIEKTMNGIKIVDSTGHKTLNIGMKAFINQLLINEYTTLKGRIDALKSKHNIIKNVPIYVNENICFYFSKPLRDTKSICINHNQVLSIRKTEDSKTEIIFKNLHILKIESNFENILRKHSLASLIYSSIH